MTRDMLERSPDLDFLYYSNDMISAGGLLYLLEKGADIPNSIGLAGFNGVELLKGLPIELATMDACRKEIGEKAAKIIRSRLDGSFSQSDKIIELSPKLSHGETLR
jgi:LacI family gluconate utilization system Gnt-I transcriptional repressor